MTQHQNKIWNNLLSDPLKIVMLTGEAGTGKSVSTSIYIKSLSPDDKVMICGSTHKSVHNLTQFVNDHICKIQFSTIHSFLGFRLINEEAQQVLKQTDIQNKKNNFNPNIIIVDEISLLPKIVLEELINYSKTNPIDKIILIGDMVQLNIDSWIELPLSKIPKYELKEQLRQNNHNDLKLYLQLLRTQIETKDPKIQQIPEKLKCCEIF
jgi:ATP-dependent exoDNAse (exonuclease V) alpha subunit